MIIRTNLNMCSQLKIDFHIVYIYLHKLYQDLHSKQEQKKIFN